MNFKIKLFKHGDSVIIFIVCICIFSYLINFVPTDIQAHLRHVKNINSGAVSYPPNFLFYYLVNFLSGFTSQDLLLYPVTVLLLSFASTAKYAFSKQIIIRLNEYGKNYSKSLKVILIAIGLFFCFAIPDPASFLFLKKMYLGKIVPIVWHNSTTILVFPFAILLFWKQLKVLFYYENVTIKTLIFLNVLVVVNILIKPSFIFCYLPVTCLFIISNYKKKELRWILLNLLPIITGGLLIIIEYYLIYALNIGSFKKESSAIMLSWPFQVYTFWIPGWLIPISFLLSLALPIATIVLYREILKYKPFIYSLALTVFGLGISALLLEAGPRMSHGNFTWQNVVCSYLLFLSTVSFLAPKFMQQVPWSKKNKLLFILFLIHIISGIMYLFKIAITKSYI